MSLTQSLLSLSPQAFTRWQLLSNFKCFISLYRSNFWSTELYPGSIIWSPSATTGFTNLVIMKLHFFHGLQNVCVGANKAPIFNGWLLCMKVLQLAEGQVWDNYTTHLLATCVNPETLDPGKSFHCWYWLYNCVACFDCPVELNQRPKIK